MVEVRKGSDRTVLLSENYAIKLPVINAGSSIRTAYGMYDRFGAGAPIKMWRRECGESPGGIKGGLMHGLIANWREARLAQQFPEVVVATKSIASVINVQPRLDTLALPVDDVMKVFSRNLKVRAAMLGHMMDDVTNFGVTDDGVRFLDGGGSGLEQLLGREGKGGNIVAALNELTHLSAENKI